MVNKIMPLFILIFIKSSRSLHYKFSTLPLNRDENWDVTLGKQGWRLMVNPESLCARVLQGKYYHTSDFMSATKKKNASHTWRAILTGRKVLQMGCIRRIGDGQSTNVWSDQWRMDGLGMRMP